MALQLPQIADVADVVAFAWLIHVGGFDFATEQRLDFSYTFKQRRGIFSSTAKIVYFSRPRIFRKFGEG